MQTVTASRTSKSTNGGPSDLSLQALSERTYGELEALYRRAENAKSMRAVDGAPKGRLLAVRGIGSLPIAPLLRAFAASSAFVWDGKTFTSRSDDAGRGINRVQIPGALGRQNLFPFETR